ncbi:glutaredoxin family protein [Zoogloea sp.]|uniref:glutaredoxin family protein n=1 Tax=Zoogloea sp. TaxID=49181 RepID=UPI00261FCE8F|nr:glutaredoxin family protein [Zoogloea sp.]MDD3354118.1 glutaredoxin family protein [Zoogloea sp.]
MDALEPLRAELGFVVEVVDVDAFPELEARWSELVPVVLVGDVELCHHFLDAAAIRQHFRQRIG